MEIKLLQLDSIPIKWEVVPLKAYLAQIILPLHIESMR